MPGQQAAPAKANHADLAARLLGCVVNRRLYVLQHARAGQVGSGSLQAHACSHVVGLVAQVNAGGHAFKHGGCNRQIPLRGEAVCHRLNVRVDTEDFLNHDDSCFGFASGLGNVSRDSKAISSFEMNKVTHNF